MPSAIERASDAALARLEDYPATQVAMGMSGGLARVGAAGRVVNAIRVGAEALAERIGKSSVTIRLVNGLKRIDLIGRTHGGVETPHVQEYRVHTNPETGASRLSKEGRVRPATAQDLREAARVAEQQQP